ncbi:TCR/Tet family MFS transporter [Sandarakinorhabdus limnophila]|uniref:TCR/Tet family MFS transporter n=1 Tax=Sandarakinorhabdus limnophila TaxID=210512 RepID=UPI0003B5555F|nr:tetracycline resistance MFS efflux pump [Sandarakinorhabdus limnophila]
MNRALAFIFITVLIDAIGFGVVIPVFPQLIVKLTGRDLANAAEVSGWIAFLYAGVQFLMGPVIGGLSDRFGRRPVLLASLAAFSLDYVVMAFAPTLWWLVAARVVAGITGATFPTAYAYIADVTPPEKRGANFGVIGMAFGFGFIIGPALGGFVAQFGTEVPFLVSAGLAMANFLYGLFVLPESLPPEKRRAFEWRRANPVGALMRLKSAHPVVLMLAATVFVWTLSYQSLYSIWSYHGQLRYGWTPEQVGWSLAAVGVTGAIVQGFLGRKLIPRFGQRRIIVVGLISAVAGYSTYAMADAGWMVYLGIAVSACQGLVFPCLQGLMSAEVAPNEQGELQGAVASIQSLSAIVGPPLMTTVFARFSVADAPIYAPGAPFVVSLVFVGITALIFFRAHAGRRVVAAE